MFKRPLYKVLEKRLSEPRRFMQVLAGPRQTGKTTLARQLMEELTIPSHYATADEPMLKDRVWIEQQWEAGRARVAQGKAGLLVIDEVQKITGWSETVKRLWDEDSAQGVLLRVILLGSSPLLVQRGLTESLAGRFEIIPVTHWSFSEMHDAFGWDVDRFIFYGGYPGASVLVDEYQRWSRYIIDSLIETTLSRDVLLMTRVDKPALLRRLFELGCSYSGRILSYQKMVGQLQDVGNTTTLAHYLTLLEGAGLLCGLSKYVGERVRQRASSPKLQVLNTALMTATSQLSFTEARKQADFWGRLVESAVGATLANSIKGTDIELFYWSRGNREVDFVLSRGQRLVAIEVKSGQRKGFLPGIEAFAKEYTVTRTLLVGTGGIPLDEFFRIPVQRWVR
jgi:hypothetical protein